MTADLPGASDHRVRRLPSPSGEAPAPIPADSIHVPSHPLAVERAEPAGQCSLLDYWRLAHGRRWTIGWAVVIGLLAAAVYNYLRTPTYRATATIQINREEPHIARLEEESSRLPEQVDYIETQYRILQSRSLARRVIHKLELREWDEFSGPGAATSGTPDQDNKPKPGALPSKLIDGFLERLTVEPAKGTRLVKVSFETADRALAPRIVNTLAQEYIEHNLESKWQATQKASVWLERQLATLRTELEASEAKVQEYAALHSILFVEERKDITTEKLAQLEDELTRAEAERIQSQSHAMLVEDAVRRGGELPGSLSSTTYQQFQGELAGLQRQQAELLVTYATDHPKVRRLSSQVKELRKAIEAEESRLLRSVRELHLLALQREDLLRQAVVSQRRRVTKLSDDFIEYGILKRDAQTNRQLYEGLLQRLKEAGVTAGLRASNVAMLDPAEAPEEPHRPRKALNLFLGLLGGLLLGTAAAFVQEQFHTAVRTPEEVEQLTGLGLLALIPRAAGRKAQRSTGRSRRAEPTARPLQIVPASPTQPQLHEDALPAWEFDPAVAEAYRTLRSSVLLGWSESMRRILVTSAQPAEGKTSVSVHLARSLASLGRRVVLIDADLRRSNCARQLGVKNESGLPDYLKGLARVDQVVTTTPVTGLSLIAGGSSRTAASDLLCSPRLGALLQQVGLKFDHVVIDSPPSLVLSDARTISRCVEGVILVVSDRTERRSLLRTKQSFDAAGVPFLGFVMNRVDLNSLDYACYRDYGYDYNYSAEREA